MQAKSTITGEFYKMAQELVMVARHSPRVRANETADNFMAGFEQEAKKHGIGINFVHGPKGEVRLSTRRQLESLTESSAKAGKKTQSKATTDEEKKKNAADLETEVANINAGKTSEFLLSKDEMLASDKMGRLLTHDKLFGKLAARLAKRGNSEVRKESASAHVGPNGEPSLVSIYLRHSRNDGDKLTDDGKALATKQGRELAKHLLENVFSQGASKVTPTIVLHVSHGGSAKNPGQLDWVFEKLLGKPVKDFGGQVSHAEGMVKLGYGDGSVKNLYLKQHGVTYLHG